MIPILEQRASASSMECVVSMTAVPLPGAAMRDTMDTYYASKAAAQIGSFTTDGFCLCEAGDGACLPVPDNIPKTCGCYWLMCYPKVGCCKTLNDLYADKPDELAKFSDVKKDKTLVGGTCLGSLLIGSSKQASSTRRRCVVAAASLGTLRRLALCVGQVRVRVRATHSRDRNQATHRVTRR